MRTAVYKTIVKPKDSKRYNNTEKIAGVDFIVHTSISDKDHRHVNKIGIVTMIPTTEVEYEVGDEVLIHHNAFRQFWNVRGQLQQSNSYINKEQFNVYKDQIYAYRKPGNKDWIMLNDNVLVKPTKENAKIRMNHDVYKPLHGTLAFGNPELSKLNIKPLDGVLFTPYSEHKFELDGVLYYRMKNQDIVYKL